MMEVVYFSESYPDHQVDSITKAAHDCSAAGVSVKLCGAAEVCLDARLELSGATGGGDH